MASGDNVFLIQRVVPTGTVFATPDTRSSGDTPTQDFPVWDFDASASEYLDFVCVMHGYDGGGITLRIKWSASSATSNSVRWEAALRRQQDDATGADLDGTHSYAYNGVTDTCASASGEPSYCTITFTDGADMDSVADGEAFVLRLYRDHDHAGDTMTGDAELWSIVGEET